MVDLVFRVGLLTVFFAVLHRGLRLRRRVAHPSRRRSLLILSWSALPSMVFWSWVALSAPIIDGPLAWPVWLSRVAFGVLGGAILVVQAIIRDVERQ